MLVKTKRILVIGASGFAGRALVPFLIGRGFDVVAASRYPGRESSKAKIVWRPMPDLGDPNADWEPLLSECEIVVHLAGLAHGLVDDGRHDAINHRGTERLAKAAAKVGVERFVFISSVAAQAGSASRSVIGEADRPQPVSAYGRSKLAAERAIQQSGVAYTILRPAAIYGLGAKGNMAGLEKIADLPIPLPFASLTTPRSLLSVENFCSATAMVLMHSVAENGVFLVADPVPLSVAEFIARRRRFAGRPVRLYAVPSSLIKWSLVALGKGQLWTRVGEPMIVSVDRLRSIGWEPQDAYVSRVVN